MSENKVAVLNSAEIIDEIKREVQEEFITSDREVFKEGLRSLTIQEQKVNKQIITLKNELSDIERAREALTEAFQNGSLHSVEDARGVVRQVADKNFLR